MKIKTVDIVLGVCIGLFLAGVALYVFVRIKFPEPPPSPYREPPAAEEPQGEPEGEPRLAWNVTSDAHPPQPSIMVTRDGRKIIDITIFGEDGKPLVVIDASGYVTVHGDVQEAARRFWEALGSYKPKCDEIH